MKWPWVSRESAERLVAYHEQAAQGWKDLFRIEATKTAALQERLLSLKMEGAAELPPIVPTPEQVQRLTLQDKPDELRDLIHERCGGDLRRRAMMLSQLKRDRADGLDADKIRESILTGVSSDGVPQ